MKSIRWKYLFDPVARLGHPAVSLPMLFAAVSLSVVSESSLAAVIARNVSVTLNAQNIESYNLDVDLDGTADFTLTAAYVPDPPLSVGFATIDFPFGGNNGVVIDRSTGDGFPTASRLAAGDTVSASNLFSLTSFDQGNLFFFTSFDAPSGNFLGQTGFLGLRFDGTGGPYYGFAEVTVNSLDAIDNPLGLTIGRVGYNNIQGQAFQIPSATLVSEPGSLPIILGGIGLLAAFRLRRPSANSGKPRRA